ncbi:F-box/kelch-repeat protein At3g06240-like [Vicia villosa]|uniref:F-box/kelch-repeat protein At3g06240-like n=1 Tax=Vicia villosa TaxID=3911 RepID=UPI00273AAA0D|nr:F-box/kelch-repeat protein At3g06240-like [Vicia villosa]
MDYQQKQSPPFNDSEVSRKYIHDDLAFYVLSKLPIKSLKRFGCVRKSWSALFENSHFMALFRNHFLSHNNCDDDYQPFLLIYLRDHADREYAELRLLDSRIKLNLPPPLQQGDHVISILGKTSVNGVFCIAQTHPGTDDINKVSYVLWNPATDEFLVIPHSPDELVPQHPLLWVNHKFHGFGYDQLRDDFKLIQYVSFDNSSCDGYDYDIDSPPPQGMLYDPFFEIYSLRNNSWKILHMDDMSPWYIGNAFTGVELYTDGACHWLLQGNQHEMVLMSFDLSDQVFFTTPIGERTELDYGYLAVLNGSVAFIINHDNDNIFHISILGELGVKESWIKLFICGPMPSIEGHPIGFGKRGYIFFRKLDDELVRVDLSTGIMEELGVKGEDYCCTIGHYQESLLPIRGS